jgi:hypothetical protein
MLEATRVSLSTEEIRFVLIPAIDRSKLTSSTSSEPTIARAITVKKVNQWLASLFLTHVEYKSVDDKYNNCNITLPLLPLLYPFENMMNEGIQLNENYYSNGEIT